MQPSPSARAMIPSCRLRDKVAPARHDRRTQPPKERPLRLNCDEIAVEAVRLAATTRGASATFVAERRMLSSEFAGNREPPSGNGRSSRHHGAPLKRRRPTMGFQRTNFLCLLSPVFRGIAFDFPRLSGRRQPRVLRPILFREGASSSPGRSSRRPFRRRGVGVSADGRRICRATSGARAANSPAVPRGRTEAHNERCLASRFRPASH